MALEDEVRDLHEQELVNLRTFVTNQQKSMAVQQRTVESQKPVLAGSKRLVENAAGRSLTLETPQLIVGP